MDLTKLFSVDKKSAEYNQMILSQREHFGNRGNPDGPLGSALSHLFTSGVRKIQDKKNVAKGSLIGATIGFISYGPVGAAVAGLGAGIANNETNTFKNDALGFYRRHPELFNCTNIQLELFLKANPHETFSRFSKYFTKLEVSALKESLNFTRSESIETLTDEQVPPPQVQPTDNEPSAPTIQSVTSPVVDDLD
ncbi:hypothetical protein J8273_0661 [Carpediemonas membranifera]|uniref:Uncharacterized protein n=1 Tax=Carpediemonas membranifera TaxID=201153 RepID=A0A8J6AXV7_9EUKA|nr:hypothetical protein J8273_0661 [Carpediemonas membranifera]|eukprot:KAG9397531.1 hypothetical protein J8273_0661 [Carpediemonas membranifera]